MVELCQKCEKNAEIADGQVFFRWKSATSLIRDRITRSPLLTEMKITLHYKLFAAMLTAILMVVIYMVLVMQWSVDRGFLNYVSTVEREQLSKIATDLEALYAQKKSWRELTANPQELLILMIRSSPEGRQKERILERLGKETTDFPMPSGPLPPDVPSHFFPRVFLLDKNHHHLLGFDSAGARSDLIPVMYQNQAVGYLGVHSAKHLSDTHQLVFVKQQKVAILLVALAGFLIAAGLSMPIAYRMARPIRLLAAATRDLASGKYSTRVKDTSGGELGQLSRDFNGLAEILEKNQRARSQWVADISHELRTPLTILRGKIEALQDGVYPPSEETFRALHREAIHLGLLVDDLYQLSLSDLGAMSYQRVEVQPCWALEQAVILLEPEFEEKQLTLETSADLGEDASLFADNERLKQLFTNLLTNSLRYTDAGGRVRISVSQQHEELVCFDIEDSAPGVSEEHLSKLFDRLYRVDSSRSRDLGGAGLGLSICYNIVKGHNGTIEARKSSLGGLLIRVCLPLSGER
jgi:two-component system sensor histidine kinase BaeS